MNLKVYLIVCVSLICFSFGAYKLAYYKGWTEGRANLVAEQQAKARAQLAKQTTRQQANDSKATAADDEGKAKTVTITQEVIRYVKTPGRNVCVFDDVRVKIKHDAVLNANEIPGYDNIK